MQIKDVSFEITEFYIWFNVVEVSVSSRHVVQNILILYVYSN